MLLKAALNGNRSREEHSTVPLSPDDLAADALAAVNAGAGAVHVHVRDACGRESLSPEDVATTVAAIRGACPGVPIGVSTGAWIEPDLTRRLAQVASWKTLPDFASVNFHEDGAESVARSLIANGVRIEAGINSAAAAKRFLSFLSCREAIRILIEPPEEQPDAATETVRQIETVLDEGGLNLPRLLHGVGHGAWPVFLEAVRRGYDTRIGLEDTLVLPNGMRSQGNADLVEAAIRLAGSSKP